MFTPLVSLRPRSELGSAAMEFLRCWLLHRSTWMILVPGILPAHLVAVPYQVYLLTHSSLAVGLIGLFQAVPIVVAGLYGGALADRFDRRRLQLIGKSATAAASLALALGAIALRAPLWFVYAVVAVAAASSTIDQSARSATIPRLVSRPLLPSAMSLGQVLFQTAAIAGPALAGAVLAGPGLSR